MVETNCQNAINFCEAMAGTKMSYAPAIIIGKVSNFTGGVNEIIYKFQDSSKQYCLVFCMLALIQVLLKLGI